MTVREPRSAWPQSLTCVALDLESTGLSPDADDIIEVGAVKFRGEEILGTFSTLVNPQRPIPAFIQILTGITDKDVEGAPSFASVAGSIEAFAGAHPIVGHNIGFDLQFLRRKGLRLPGPAYDTFDLATILLPDLPDYSLASVCQGLDVAIDRPHRALPDAQMAAAVFARLIEALGRLSPEVLAEAARMAKRCDWSLRYVIQQIADGVGGSPLQSSEPGLQGVDLHMLAKRLKVEVGPSERKGQQAIDMSSIGAVLGEKGALSKTLERFESRPEQVQMAEAVAQAFQKGGRLIAEAGTGTGKSLAYLVPAALFAHQSGKPVVISTNTINLQEQIIGKDIPAALAALVAGGAIGDAAEVPFTLLKGRGNYLCLARWATLKGGDLPLTVAEARTLIKVLLWLRNTESGDRGELNLTPPEAAVWGRISAQGFDDRGGPCPFARRGLCFYHAARQRAEGAQLVVVNHALLTLDARLESLLPGYSHLVIDEAHNLEDVATNQWGAEVDEAELDDFLGRIVGGQGPVGAGILGAFRLALRSIALPEGGRKDLAALIEQVDGDAQSLRSHLAALFRVLGDFLEKRTRANSTYEPKVHLTPAVRADPAWAKTRPIWENIDLVMGKIEKDLAGLHASAEQFSASMGGNREERLLEIDAVHELGEQLRANLAAMLGQPEESMVYWLGASGTESTLRLHSAPLHVGPILKHALFASKETVILTGATLSTEGNFEYVKERLCVEPTSELLLGSPFDYSSLALIYVPSDMPEPGSPTYQDALNRIIADVSQAAGGKTLALFTSRATLRNTRSGLREDLGRCGITVLGQGIDGSPRQLVKTFKSTPNTVLLGSGSFWEGVDIGGGALSVLVITRLPFTVPSEPVFAARSQKFDDPFSSYAVPQAVIRFRQGFGRLIRRKTDRGVLVILDRRVFSKRYGTAFLDSIPRCARKIAPAKDLPAEALRWLAQRPLE